MPEPRYPLIRYLATESEYVARVRRALEDASKQVNQAMLNASLAEEGRLAAQRAAIQSHLNGAWSTIEQAVYEGQRAAIDEAASVLGKYESDLLDGWNLTPEVKDAILTSEAVRAQAGVQAVAARAQFSRRALADTVWGAQSAVNSKLDKLIDEALARGMSARELASMVRQYVNPNTPGGASYAAMRIARTEINNAYHAASVESYKRSKMVEKVKWNLSSSHPEGDICDSYANDGPYDVNEVPEKPHPHCFCFTTAELPTREQFINDLFDGKYDDDDSATPVDDNDYDLPFDWKKFSGKSSSTMDKYKYEWEQQQRALGRTYRDYKDTPTYKRMLQEMQEKRAAEIVAKKARKAAGPAIGVTNQRTPWKTTKGLRAIPAKPADLSRRLGKPGAARPTEVARRGANPMHPSFGGARRSDLAYEINCTRVSATVEMRARGYNVVARGAPEAADKSNDWIVRNWVDRDGNTRIETHLKSMASVDRAIKPGERYLMWFQWKNGGAHIVNVERGRDGVVRIMEGQIRQTGDGVDLASYLSRIQIGDGFDVKLLRVDDLLPSEHIWDAMDPIG